MKYRPDIDGLRAFAVLSVLIYHANAGWLSGGFIGVDIFFVISGFLITTIIHREIIAGEFSIVRFYERRMRRILPALTVVTLACVPFAWWLMIDGEWTGFSKSILGVSTFLSNIVFWGESGYFDTSSAIKPLLHTWSLAVEEQFYIIMPIIMIVIWKFSEKNPSPWREGGEATASTDEGKATNAPLIPPHNVRAPSPKGEGILLALLIAMSFISLGLSEVASRTYPDFNFYMLPTRMWELLAGSIIGVLMVRHGRLIKNKSLNDTLALMSFITIIASFFIYNHDIRFPSLWAVFPIYATALLIVTSNADNLTGKILSWKPFVWVGLASYSIYLWHQPVLSFTRLYIDAPLSIDLMMACIVASITIGFLSWRFIERPFRSKDGFSQKQVFILGIGALGLMFAVGGLGMVKHKIFPETNPAILKIQKHAVNHQGKLRDCDNKTHGFCTIGDASKTPNILLWGDSHGGSLGVGMDNVLAEQNKSAYILTTGGCPAMINTSRSINGVADKNCNDIARDFENNFNAIERDIDTVILSMRWSRHITPSTFDNGEGGVETLDNKVQLIDLNGNEVDAEMTIKNTIQYLKNNGKRVIITYPIPEMGWHVPKKLIRQIKAGKMPDASISYDVFKNYNQASFNILDKLENIKRIYPHETLCDSARCGTITDDGIPLYFDDDHISPYAAEIISREILK